MTKTTLIIARHGNTFDPSDKVVMAGLKNDIPLVKKGFEQAEAVAQALVRTAPDISAIYASELIRTQQGATVAAEALDAPVPAIDKRLNELDYGLWTGLSDDEINAQFGETDRLAWQKDNIWPPSAHQWGQSAEEVTAEVSDFAKDLLENHTGETVFAVCHGGRLRFFLNLVEKELQKRIENQTLKVKTGHLCQLSHNGKKWQVDAWNCPPEKI